jgi:hypothetical protein
MRGAGGADHQVWFSDACRQKPDGVGAARRVGLLGNQGERVAVDLVKLPHHGSRNNVSRALVEAIDCPTWVFSSDGTTFRHPDAVAVSRVVRDAGPDAHLVFNVPITFNEWWRRPGWEDLFGYTTSYGVEGEGITVTLS